MQLPILYNHSWLKVTLEREGYDAFPDSLKAIPSFEGALRDWHDFCSFFEPVCVHDRSGQLAPLLPMHIIDPMPSRAEVEAFQMSFAEVCAARAGEMVATGKPIELYWSGGIDSTVAMIALVQAGVRRDQLHVRLTYNSIMEYGQFFQKTIKPFPHTISLQGDVKHTLTLSPDKIVTTGELGDQMFGSGTMSHYSTVRLFGSYQDVVPERIQEITAPVMAAAPTEVRSLNDYIWYVNFSMKYQSAKTRFLIRNKGVSGDFNDQMRHFFDDKRFQLWSLAGKEPKIAVSHASYKLTARNYIHAFTQDLDYARNKIKVNSLKNIQALSWRFLLRDGQVVHDVDFDAYMVQLAQYMADHPHWRRPEIAR